MLVENLLFSHRKSLWFYSNVAYQLYQGYTSALVFGEKFKAAYQLFSLTSDAINSTSLWILRLKCGGNIYKSQVKAWHKC